MCLFFFEIILKKNKNMKNKCLIGKKLLRNRIFIDFNQDDYKNIEKYLNSIIYNNYFKLSYALKYKTLIKYRTQLGFE